MNILFVSSGNNNYFGLSPFIKSQGESLRKVGAKVDFYTIKGKGIKGYLSNVKKLKKHIRAGNYNLIHVHYSLSGWVVLLTGSTLPKILSLMGSDVHGSSTQDGRTNFAGKLLTYQAFLIQFFFRAIISKSRNLSKVIIRKKNIHIIPNGVDFEKFKPMDKIESRKTLGLNEKEKLILFLGAKENTNKNFKLGKEAIEMLDVRDTRLIAPYPVDHKDIPIYLNACDVLLFTSYKEGSPNVIKEALACNTIIVTTPSGDILERIKGANNVFVAEFSAKSVCQKIMEAINFQEEPNSRDIVKNELDENVIARKLISIYETHLRDEVS
ncbi:MAG: glycosyltransferase family 4 protein [Bacteroidales bacterium]|nr:glycosyltransferase family 4 protein [Bacteroidales bacterium]MCF8402546.1 glycosyltransferase family 4 protein [Bacteroidales bacterium]